MSIAPALWVLQEAGPTTRFYVRRRTLVSTAQVAVRRAACATRDSRVDDDDDGRGADVRCVLWCSIVPAKARQAGDGEYRNYSPFVLATFALPPSPSSTRTTPTCVTTHEHSDATPPATTTTTSEERAPCNDDDTHVVTLPVRQWTIEGGSTVVLTLTATTAAHGDNNNNNNNVDGDDAASTRIGDVVFYLSGMHVGLPFVPAVCEWRPLLSHRWFELKPHVRQATHVPTGDTDSDTDRDEDDSDSTDRRRRRGCGRSGHAIAVVPHTSRTRPRRRRRDASTPMYQGEVREAHAVSANGSFVKWCDGAVGPMDELRPFRRLYTPARAEKVVRVRRYPHRHADVVGQVSFGTVLEAFGKATDVYTRESYVLVYLPHDARDATGASYAHLVTMYGLTYTSAGRHIWGWTKLAGTSELPLLAEVPMTTHNNHNSSHSDATAALALTPSVEVDDDGQHRHTPTIAVAAAAAAAHASLHATPSAGHTDTHDAMTHHERHLRKRQQEQQQQQQQQEGKTDATEPAGTQRVALPAQTFYVPVRHGKRVRVRAAPSLRARTVRDLDTNEVRQAVALVRVPMLVDATPASSHEDASSNDDDDDDDDDEDEDNDNNDKGDNNNDDKDNNNDNNDDKDDSDTRVLLYHEFVQWYDNTYSLLRDHDRTYLVPVNLTAGIRRYPVRSRTSTATATAAHDTSHDQHKHDDKGDHDDSNHNDDEDDDAIDLDEVKQLSLLRQQQQQRRRTNAYATASAGRDSSDDDDDVAVSHTRKRRRDDAATRPGAATSTSDVAPLLSPQHVPAAVREGVQRGRVRLDDLQPLPHSTRDMAASDKDSDDDDTTAAYNSSSYDSEA